MSWRAALEQALDDERLEIDSLSGGCVGEVYLVRTAGGDRYVAKVDEAGTGGLLCEAEMLRFLRSKTKLPIPEVHHAEQSLLLMEWLPGKTGCGPRAEPHMARLLAELHAVRGERFGFDSPTRIGGLEQPNEWHDAWVPFFASQRLLPMVRAAVDAGRLRRRVATGVERIAGRLDEWLTEPKTASLLHGDVWSGNVLSEGERITGLIDPAIYYGHPEIEIAFTTMFSTFGDGFFRVYGSVGCRLDSDFFEVRRHVYNLYPLLVHTRLFGGSYAKELENLVKRFA